MPTNLCLLFFILLGASEVLNAQLEPRIDPYFDLNPYGYIESAPGSKMNQSRLYLDKVFSGFNLTFTYRVNNSTKEAPVNKSLDISKTVKPISEGYIQVKPFVNSNSSEDAFVILYNDSIVILKITADGSFSTSQKAFSGLPGTQCNDFIQLDLNRIILNCWNNELNRSVLGYYNLTISNMSYFTFDQPINASFSDTRLRKIPSDNLLIFWRYYKIKNWLIEEWRIDEATNLPALNRILNSTQLDSSSSVLQLVDVHMLDRNLTILFDSKAKVVLVNWAVSPPEIMSIYTLDSELTITGGRMFFTSETTVLFIEFDNFWLKGLRIKDYNFEDMTYVFAPELAEKIYDYALIDTHILAIHSVNLTGGSSYLSIATLYPYTNGDVVYNEVTSVPVAGFILNSKFSGKFVATFYSLMDGSLFSLAYTKPYLLINATILSGVYNLVDINVTSTTKNDSMWIIVSYPVYFYNDTYFQVDTSQVISSDKFLYGVYPNPKKITLKDIGVQAPFPKIIEILPLAADVNDYDFVDNFNLIPNSEGVAALDPRNTYWVFKMGHQSSVYRCTYGLGSCEYKGIVHWPVYQKRVEVLTDAYPFIVLSYPSSERIYLSTFTLARVYESSDHNIEEKYNGSWGSNPSSHCQSLQVKKIDSSSYLLCLDSDISNGNTSLTIFYLYDLFNVSSNQSVKSIRNASIALEGFPSLDPEGYVGLNMVLYEDLMFIMMDANFTLYCYNLSTINYSQPTEESVQLVEQHQAFNQLNGARETYFFINTDGGILIIACPELGMLEEWLIMPNNPSGSVLNLYGQTLTYGEIFDRETIIEYKVSSPVSYSKRTNTLYMMTSLNGNNNIYVYRMDYRGANYPYIPRLARGKISSSEMKNALVGISAVQKDSDSDYLILWSSKNTLYQYFKELQLMLDTYDYNSPDPLEIYELQLDLKVASSFAALPPTTVNFNFSLYYMENVITAVNTSGSGGFANKITLENTSIIWAMKPEDYFTGDVIQLEIKTQDPSDYLSKHIRLLKRTEEDDWCKISTPLEDMYVFGAHLRPDNFSYLLTNSSLLKINTTQIFITKETSAAIFYFSSPLTQFVNNFFMSPQGRWMHFYYPYNQTIVAHDLRKVQQGQLPPAILQNYSYSTYYQARFFNESILSLTFECSSSNGSCWNETFISLWDLYVDQKSTFLTFSDLSRSLNLNITKQTQILTKLKSLKDPDSIVVLAAITDVPMNIYWLAVCAVKVSTKTLACNVHNLNEIITDYNISRYGVDWNTIDIMSSNSNESYFSWEVLLGNTVHNSYVLNVVMFRANSSSKLAVLYGLDNYLPNTYNSKISWSRRYIAVERDSKQVENNLTKLNPHVLYYDRFTSEGFDVGQSYKLIKTIGVSDLFQYKEISVLDLVRDSVLLFPLKIFKDSHNQINIRDFYGSFKIEFNNVSLIKSKELELCAQNFGSFSSVKIELTKHSPPGDKPYLPVIIAFGLLLIGLLVGGLYYLYQKRVKAKKKMRRRMEADNETQGLNLSRSEIKVEESLIHHQGRSYNSLKA